LFFTFAQVSRRPTVAIEHSAPLRVDGVTHEVTRALELVPRSRRRISHTRLDLRTFSTTSDSGFSTDM
jgi:hypothetical protein